ncbi:cadherin domain/calx-beta domain protein [Pseudooceanicola batsensis HTCC2597]|uniref:Cadherin domain/calx-beta domain protein n=1 Tax=Pseudooceanicola batsensis (strain ATCC BAA-863 / DSM 15984 / KCTC 12145 / HTCC2597) TaxID=252305 RepID=A3TUK0_PSEBH|nr:Ig-like domain-containing protein [Pseudooceanicola batsensis]EAQ04196.1 cadherin domain/calx-beta domain protein [Pseudooceanicola batsensis HTCC2597]
MGNYGSRIIVGRDGEYDRTGYTVSGIGDFNGDGIGDFAVTARNGENRYGSDTGSVYVVYGTGDAELRFDLDDIDGTNGFEVRADVDLDNYDYGSVFGSRVTALGDVNNDGTDDFGIVQNATSYGSYSGYYGYYGYYGEYGYGYTASRTNGVAYVIYGGQDVAAAGVDVDDLDHFRLDADGEIVGMLGLEDVNGDGIADIGLNVASRSAYSGYNEYYYVYDANGNGYYDYDYDTNPDEFMNSHQRYTAIDDVTGYVVYGTGDARDNVDNIADQGGSSVIVDVTNLQTGEGTSFDLGQVLAGNFGFYGEVGLDAFASSSIGDGNTYDAYDYGVGLAGSVDIDGDGFADVIMTEGSVYAEDAYVVNTYGSTYYSGGVFAYIDGTTLADVEGDTTTRLTFSTISNARDGVAGLGNFSGNDAPQEIAVSSFVRPATDFPDEDLPGNFLRGVYVLNGTEDFFDSSFRNVGPTEVMNGAASFFYSALTYTASSGSEFAATFSIDGVLGIGDFDGDGIDDMLIAATQYNADELRSYDVGFVVLGTEGARTGLIELEQLVADGGAYKIVAPENSDIGMIARAGDVDNDGNQDLIVGEPSAESGLGLARILHGGADALEAADNADGSDDNIINYGNFLVDVDTGLVPIEVSIQNHITGATEGDTEAVELSFTVSRTGDLSAEVTVDWAVAGASDYFYADADADDFQGGAFPSGTVTFAAGEDTATISVSVAGDLIDENTEDFRVVLSDPTTDSEAPIHIGNDTAYGFIYDNDDPMRFRVYNSGVNEGDPGDDNVLRLQVYRYGKTDIEGSIDWSVTVYTANTSISAEDEDFEDALPQSGTITFAAGESIKYIELPIAEDQEIEDREYVDVRLSNATAEGDYPTEIVDGVGYGWIDNDDFPVQFSVDDTSVTEGDGEDVTLTFTITRSGITDADATVDYRLASSGATAADFSSGYIDPETGQPMEGTLEFAAGETTKTVSVQVAGDDIDENTEYLYIYLTNPTTTDTNTPQISDSFGRGSIFDDDDSVEYRVFNASATEGADGEQTALTFTITRGGLTGVAGTVDFSLEAYVSSSAADATDFASGFPQSGTLEFAAGETTKTVTAFIADDEAVESTEYVQLVLSNPTAEGGESAKITDGNGIGSIFNDDIPVSFSANSVSVNEGDDGETPTASVRVYRTGETSVEASLDYTIQPFVSSQAADDDDIVDTFNLTGTVDFAAGETFKDITFDIQGDDVQEEHEYIQVIFSNPTAVGAPVQLATGSVTVTILNDDVPVSFSVNNAATTEGQSGEETPLTFTVYRSGPSDIEATVDYQLRAYQPSASISAESPDFTGGLPASGTVTFGVGETSKTLTFQVRDDEVYEQTEYVELLLSNPVASANPQGAQISDDYGRGTIYDDEIPVYFRVYSDTVTEGDPGETETLRFLVQRTGDTGVDASVDYSVSTYYYRGATDADLAESMSLPISGTVSFAAGETQKYVEIDVAGDNAFEGTEYLQIDLSNAASDNAAVLPVIQSSRAYGYINDDDIPTYFRVSGYSATEGDAGDNNVLQFIVTRYGDTSAGANVDYDVSGGTVDAADFDTGEWPTSGTLSFAAGETSKTVSLVISGDQDVENDEYTYMRLSNATSDDAEITAQITTSTASAVIRNDDFPAYLSVSYSTSVTEGDTSADNTELTFTVYRSGDTTSAVSVDYDFAGDSYQPVSSADFEAGLPQSGTIEFAASETQKTVSFRIAEDTEIEGNERGKFVLSNAQLVSGASDATVQITRSTSIGTIYNDDQPPAIQVLVNGSAWGTSVNEGQSGFTEVPVVFVREGDLSGALTVNYELQTVQGNVFWADSQDIEGFLPANGLSVSFADGESTSTAVVRINGDGLIEANESLTVRVTGYDSEDDISYQVLNPSTSIIIRNDDGRPPIPELPFDVDGDGVIEEGEFIRVEADVFGDPHIITLDGLGYDFQAVGEYVLVETEDGASNPFSVQVRFEAFPGSDLVSVTTRMAVEVKGKTIEIDAHDPDSPLLIDGVAVDIEAAKLSGIDLDDDDTNANDIFITEDGKFFIRLNDANEQLMVGMLDGALNVCVFLGDPADGGNAGAVRGLMGNANQDLTDDFSLRDGSEIPDEVISFDDDGTPSLDFDYIYGFGDYEGGGYKASWALQDGEALFSGDTPDYPENFPAAPLKLENLPQSVQDKAIQAARDAGVDESDPVIFNAAALDFALTGMGAFLGGATQLAADPQAASDVTEAPDIVPTANVTADLTSVTEGDSGVQEVTFTFYRLGGTNGALEVSYAIGGDIDAADLADDTDLTGTVSFEDGEDEVSLTVLVKGDLMTEGNEALEVSITGTDNEAVLVGAAQGATTIVTDDTGPAAQNDSLSGEAGATVSGNVFADNGQGEDTDADDDTLVLTGITIGGTEYDVTDSPITLADGQVLTIDDEGNFQFETGSGFADLLVGEVGSFEFGYEVSDGNGGTDTAMVTLSITGTATENRAPVVEGETAEVDEDGRLDLSIVDLLSNDSDPDGDTLEITEVSALNGTVTTGQPFGGNGPGSFYVTYEPDDDYNGPDTITYVVSDGNGNSTSGEIAVTVNPVNDNPTAVVDTGFTTDEDTHLFITEAELLANDFDIDGDTTLSVTPFTSNLRAVEGGFEFTPGGNFNGTAYASYILRDGNGGSSIANIEIEVLPVNDAPLLGVDSYTAGLGTTLAVDAADGLLDNDSDADGDDLSVVDSEEGALGTFVVNADGSFTYTPFAGVSGSETLSYTVSDQTVEVSGSVTFTIDESTANKAPIAVGDSYDVSEDAVSVVLDVLGNDSDPDGDDIFISAFSQGSNGTVALVGDTLVYTPVGNYTGADSFTYTISNGDLTNTATVDITVLAENDLPVFTDTGPFTVAENSTAVGTVTASDVDGDGLSFGIAAGKDGGLFDISSDGTLSFKVAPDYEAPGDGNTDNSYLIDVTVFDGTETVTTEVTVNVTDEDEGPELNEILGTTGRDYLLGTSEADVFIFNGGFGDMARGQGGADVFDVSVNMSNGVRDASRIFDWSEDDALSGITLADVEMATVRSLPTALLFTYGPDNDMMTITGDVSGGINSLFGLDV